MNLPNEINILGTRYKITYIDKPSEVDIFGRHSYWGQMDYWTRTIRVYKNDRNTADIWKTIMHEMLHGILHEMKEHETNKNEKFIDMLASFLVDTLSRNKMDFSKMGE